MNSLPVTPPLRVSGLPFTPTLWISGQPQSGGLYHAIWKKVLAHTRHSPIRHVLLLGLGGGTAVRHLLRLHPQAKITAVELEPTVVQLALKRFLTPLERSRTQIIIQDAASQPPLPRPRFDLIIVDLFAAERNPAFARKRSYLLKLNRLLAPGGVVIYNSHYFPGQDVEFARFTTLCSSLYRVQIIHSAFHHRYLLLSPLVPTAKSI